MLTRAAKKDMVKKSNEIATTYFSLSRGAACSAESVRHLPLAINFFKENNINLILDNIIILVQTNYYKKKKKITKFKRLHHL
jgi:hypothetical protein